jgi:hypothetical protein
MSIPAQGLTDEELLHYAALEPEAAIELTRRLTAQCIDPSAELNQLREEIEDISSGAEDAENDLANCQNAMHEAAQLIHAALELDASRDDIIRVLKEALNCLE